ncbi:unnamed protein product [Anisakis simplex]|uniref:Uncharacterized protein n=1 Tax=Anisakis simplex TaxID=6269 RepID=A0A0M3JH21_ANISI|nr:unnamed protein product [Anisakis simplex]
MKITQSLGNHFPRENIAKLTDCCVNVSKLHIDWQFGRFLGVVETGVWLLLEPQPEGRRPEVGVGPGAESEAGTGVGLEIEAGAEGLVGVGIGA